MHPEVSRHVRERAHSFRAISGRCFIPEPEALPGVVGKEQQEDQRGIQEVAVYVLQDQRQAVLTRVLLSRLSDRTRRRIGPERLVIGAPIVVARESEQSREGQDDQRG